MGAEGTTHATDAPAEGLDRLRLLAVDVETTGLDWRSDRLLAVGFVPVDGRRIDLAGARRIVLQAEDGPGASVWLHRLTHDVLASGRPAAEALREVLDALAGRTLLAHHAVLEQEFLSRACEEVGFDPSPLLGGAVDTMQLQHRILVGRRHSEPPPGSLRLWAARDRFGLPPAPPHDPLSDALACAELYLAQAAELGEEAVLRALGRQERGGTGRRLSAGWRSVWRRRGRS